MLTHLGGALLQRGDIINIPRVIAFFGPDGAGKSTQAILMVDYLKSKGFKVKRAWVRSVHTFAYLLWMLFYKLNLYRGDSRIPVRMRFRFAVSYLNESSYGAVTPITMSPPILKGSISRFVWSVIEILSIIPVVILQVYLPLLLNRVVVAERFVVDSVASIAYFLNDEDFAGSWRAKFLLRLVPRDTVFVFVDANYEEILARRDELAGSREYTDFHRRLYRRLAREVGAFRVDTSRNSIREAHQKILNSILQ